MSNYLIQLNWGESAFIWVSFFSTGFASKEQWSQIPACKFVQRVLTAYYAWSSWYRNYKWCSSAGIISLKSTCILAPCFTLILHWRLLCHHNYCWAGVKYGDRYHHFVESLLFVSSILLVALRDTIVLKSYSYLTSTPKSAVIMHNGYIADESCYSCPGLASVWVFIFFIILNLLVKNRWRDGRNSTSAGGRNIRSSLTSVWAHLVCLMKVQMITGAGDILIVYE
jgi:hypothetical protein